MPPVPANDDLVAERRFAAASAARPRRRLVARRSVDVGTVVSAHAEWPGRPRSEPGGYDLRRHRESCRRSRADAKTCRTNPECHRRDIPSASRMPSSGGFVTWSEALGEEAGDAGLRLVRR